MIPSIYRIHEEPETQRLADYRVTNPVYGIEVGDLSQRREMQRFLKTVAGRPEESGIERLACCEACAKPAYLRICLVIPASPKTITPILRARSAAMRICWCIFVRVDVAAAGRKPPDRWTSKRRPNISPATERTAAEAEREAVRLKKMEYFAGIPEAAPSAGYGPGGAKLRALVELKEALVVGMIRISSLDHDFFVFDPARQRITGRRSKNSFAVGDRVMVRVARVDSFRQRIDFAFLAKE